MSGFWSHIDKLESYVCRAILAVFVTLLFVQVVARQVFSYNFTWIEELSTVLFVWFAYFGASYAARMAAHNRVTFHINAMPRRYARMVEALGDLFWIVFNVVFIYYAIDFLMQLKPFLKMQTLGWQRRYVMMVLPIAFTLMTIRILQVNYMKLVMGIDPRDPDSIEVDNALDLAEDEDAQYRKVNRNG